jgi:hypothetical protein
MGRMMWTRGSSQAATREWLCRHGLQGQKRSDTTIVGRSARA